VKKRCAGEDGVRDGGEGEEALDDELLQLKGRDRRDGGDLPMTTSALNAVTRTC
jgi:hypothetical protein